MYHTLKLEDECVGLASDTAIKMQTIEKNSLDFFVP